MRRDQAGVKVSLVLETVDGAGPSAAGPIALAVSVAVQITLTALLLAGGRPAVESSAELTARGLRLMRPEREVMLFALGCVLALALAVAFTWRRRRQDSGENAPAARVVPVALAVWSLAAQLVLVAYLKSAAILPLDPNRGFPAGLAAALLAPAALTLLVVVVWPARRAAADLAGDAVALVALAAIAHSPASRYLAGIAYLGMERANAGSTPLAEAFHHWNFFAMAPALGFLHGRALITDVYSQYGVGWPMWFAAIAPVAPLAYSTLMAVSVAYSLVYLFGVYLLVRLVTRSAPWATLASLLCAAVYLYSGNIPGTVLHIYPSFTAMRAPMDIWFFIALWRHASTLRGGPNPPTPFHKEEGGEAPPPSLPGKGVGGLGLPLALGALLGLAIVFGTDTGVLLAVACAAYWLSLFVAPPGGATRGQVLGGALACGLAAVVVAGAGFFVATRGTLFGHAFWSAWLEVLPLYASGLGLELIARNRTPVIVYFGCALAVYLVAVSRWLVHTLRRSLDPRVLLTGCLAVYALGLLSLYVSRSYEYTLYPLTIPLVILVTLGAASAWRQAMARLPQSLARAGAPWSKALYAAAPSMCVTVAALALLWGNPAFREFPSWLQIALRGWPDESLCLVQEPRDVCGLPAYRTATAEQFLKTTGQLARVAKRGSLAIFDDNDTLYYATLGLAPWGRYSPLFPNLLMQFQLDAVLRELQAAPPDYIAMLGSPSYRNIWKSTYKDVWDALRGPVVRAYLFDRLAGSFEVWHKPREGDLLPVADALFDGRFRLTGYRIGDRRAGEALAVDLRWAAEDVPSGSCTTFIHLLDGSGRRAAQSDAIPAMGAYPTERWKPGEVVLDRHELGAGSLAPGRYELQVGLYDTSSGARLPVWDVAGNPRDSKFDLARFTVTGVSPERRPVAVDPGFGPEAPR